MKLTCLLVLFIVAPLVFSAPSGPCNPAIAYHGSECNCESKLPYQVQSPAEAPRPVQVQTYQFAIRYPVQQNEEKRMSQVYDAKVQQVQINPDQKLLV